MSTSERKDYLYSVVGTLWEPWAHNSVMECRRNSKFNAHNYNGSHKSLTRCPSKSQTMLGGYKRQATITVTYQYSRLLRNEFNTSDKIHGHRWMSKLLLWDTCWVYSTLCDFTLSCRHRCDRQLESGTPKGSWSNQLGALVSTESSISGVPAQPWHPNSFPAFKV